MAETTTIVTAEVFAETDLLRAQRRAAAIAGLLGLDGRDRMRVATALSELARNALRHAGGGRVAYQLARNDRGSMLVLRVSDDGPGIPDEIAQQAVEGLPGESGQLGLAAVGRVMDHMEVASAPGRGATVSIGKTLPHDAADRDLDRIAEAVVADGDGDPADELQRCNRELLGVLAELRAQQEALARDAELREKMLRVVAHDLRSPLNAIAVNAQLVSIRPDQAARSILDSTRAIERLLGDLLDVSSIEAGRLAIDPAPLAPSDAIESAIAEVQAAADEAEVTLTREIEDGLPLALADGQRTSQALASLVANAVDSSPNGASVTVEARRHGVAEIELAVVDRGTGIAAEDRERVFDRFWRGPGRRRHGTGLGLAIARGIAEAHGGEIGVESEVGQGSRFWLTLPAIVGADDLRAGS